MIVRRMGIVGALMVAPWAGAAFADEPLNVCVVVEQGTPGDAAAWVSEFSTPFPKDHDPPPFGSVRSIVSVDAASGCDAIIQVRSANGFWGDQAMADVLSGYTRRVVFHGAEGHRWTDLYVWVDGELTYGDAGKQILADRIAECPTGPSRNTPFCQQVAQQAAQQQAAAQREAGQREANKALAAREKISAWRALKVKPPLPDGAHKYKVLAENAVKEKRYDDAVRYYEQGLDVEPMWPEGQYNVAVLEGELGKYAAAAAHMRVYVEMMPEAKDTPAAQDKIIIWDEKARR